MNKIKINLQGANSITPTTKKIYFVLGLSLTLIYSFILIKQIRDNDLSGIHSSIINIIIYILLFIFLGIIQFSKKFNKFIKIDDKTIAFKNQALKHPKIIKIDNIKQFVIKPASITCRFENDFSEINLAWVSYKDIQEIKKAIKEVAKEKMIKIIE